MSNPLFDYDEDNLPEFDYSKTNFISQFQQPSIHVNAYPAMQDESQLNSMILAPMSTQEQSTLPLSSKFGSSQLTSQMTSKILFGKYDEDLFKKESEKEQRIERIKAVRMQERGAAHQSVMQYHSHVKMKMEAEEQERLQQEYLKKV